MTDLQPLPNPPAIAAVTRLARALVALMLGLLAAAASAHEISMAEVEIRQLAKNEFVWQWTASGSRPLGQALTPRWPDGCAADGNTLRCGDRGLVGTLAIDGVGKRYSAVIVKLFWQDAPAQVHTLTAGQPAVRLYGAAEDPRGASEIAWTYGVLGVEHILGGIDHLLFVLALLFLVGFNRKLVWTITAFTLAHSITLALASLGLLTLRSPPVEATIALSIVLVAAEALHRRETLSRRWPALVAFGFGLVHGLGFAGALEEIGLPENHLAIALLTFNLGVEAGQLAVVAIAFGIYRLLAGMRFAERMRTAMLYGIGGIAAYWSIARMVAIVA